MVCVVALAGVAQVMGGVSHGLGITGSIPRLGACQGRLNSVSLSLRPFPPPEISQHVLG